MSNRGRGYGKGRGGPRQGIGGPSHCVCPACGKTIVHRRGLPCIDTICPKCGRRMLPSI